MLLLLCGTIGCFTLKAVTGSNPNPRRFSSSFVRRMWTASILWVLHSRLATFKRIYSCLRSRKLGANLPTRFLFLEGSAAVRFKKKIEFISVWDQSDEKHIKKFFCSPESRSRRRRSPRSWRRRRRRRRRMTLHKFSSTAENFFALSLFNGEESEFLRPFMKVRLGGGSMKIDFCCVRLLLLHHVENGVIFHATTELLLGSATFVWRTQSRWPLFWPTNNS